VSAAVCVLRVAKTQPASRQSVSVALASALALVRRLGAVSRFVGHHALSRRPLARRTSPASFPGENQQKSNDAPQPRSAPRFPSPAGSPAHIKIESIRSFVRSSRARAPQPVFPSPTHHRSPLASPPSRRRADRRPFRRVAAKIHSHRRRFRTECAVGRGMTTSDPPRAFRDARRTLSACVSTPSGMTRDVDESVSVTTRARVTPSSAPHAGSRVRSKNQTRVDRSIDRTRPRGRTDGRTDRRGMDVRMYEAQLHTQSDRERSLLRENTPRRRRRGHAYVLEVK